MSPSSDHRARVVAPATEDHERGLQQVAGTLLAVSRPAPSLARYIVDLSSVPDPTPWCQPNLAFRLQLGPAYGGITRIYTVREFEPATRQLQFDVVLHAGDSPMMQWVAAARAGHAVELIGPRPHLGIPVEGARPVAMFLDQSAIPALHSLLLQWPAGIGAVAWIACPDPEPVDELPVVDGVVLHRIAVSYQAGAGSLFDHARALAEPARHAVWAAGERDQMRAIRQYFCGQVGLARQQVAVAGYWKRGESTSQTDRRRRRHYEQLLAQGGSLADFDDLADEI